MLVQPPGQTAVGDAVAFIVGIGTTVTVTVCCVTHPAALSPKSVYVVVIVGDKDAIAELPPVGTHV